MNPGEILGLSDVLKDMAVKAMAHPTSGLAEPEQWLTELAGGTPATSGMVVNEETAMKVTTVQACVRILAGIRGMLPLEVYQRTSSGGKARVTEHPSYFILHDQYNEEQPSFQGRENGCVAELLWGNSYAYIELTGKGELAGIWPLDPSRVKPFRDPVTRRILYLFTPWQGPQVTFEAWQILHVAGLGFDGLVGKSRIAMAREAIGLALVLEKHGAAFFGTGGRPSVALSHPGKANRKIADNIKKQWNLDHAGPDNLEKPSVLFEGMKIETYSMPNDDAQFLGSRDLQVRELGPRVFLVPSWLLGATETASNYGTGIEQQGIAFVQYGLLPELKRSEQAMNMKLYTRADRERGLFVEFNVDGLLRGDFKSRMEGFQIAVGGPFMSRDEARGKENLERRGGPMDEVLQNLNQSTSGEANDAARRTSGRKFCRMLSRPCCAPPGCAACAA